ncbi:MAG: hypothetical protein K0S07_23 [Chlamydiales bacterium]|jgi:hypothetical protein|nr:hypothetical protein [Chlamydiales bacterium]
MSIELSSTGLTIEVSHINACNNWCSKGAHSITDTEGNKNYVKPNTQLGLSDDKTRLVAIDRLIRQNSELVRNAVEHARKTLRCYYKSLIEVNSCEIAALAVLMADLNFKDLYDKASLPAVWQVKKIDKAVKALTQNEALITLLKKMCNRSYMESFESLSEQEKFDELNLSSTEQTALLKFFNQSQLIDLVDRIQLLQIEMLDSQTKAIPPLNIDGLEVSMLVKASLRIGRLSLSTSQHS